MGAPLPHLCGNDGAMCVFTYLHRQYLCGGRHSKSMSLTGRRSSPVFLPSPRYHPSSKGHSTKSVFPPSEKAHADASMPAPTSVLSWDALYNCPQKFWREDDGGLRSFEWPTGHRWAGGGGDGQNGRHLAGTESMMHNDKRKQPVPSECLPHAEHSSHFTKGCHCPHWQ